MPTSPFACSTNSPARGMMISPAAPSILQRTQSAFPDAPHASVPKMRACSFSEKTNVPPQFRPSAPVHASEGSLLARRLSSKRGNSQSSTPVLQPLPDLKLPPMPKLVDPHAIREHIIGTSAIDDLETPTLPSDDYDDGEGDTFEMKIKKELVERKFRESRRRKPTPFPESREAFIHDDESELEDEDSLNDDSEDQDDGTLKVVEKDLKKL